MLAISTKLATEVYKPSNETGVEKHDLEVEKDNRNTTEQSDLESVLTNHQEDVNIEVCSVTNKNKKWWPWSKQKQSESSSDDERINQMQGNQSQPSQDSVMVAAELERKSQIAEEEMEHKFADIAKEVGKVSYLGESCL